MGYIPPTLVVISQNIVAQMNTLHILFIQTPLLLESVLILRYNGTKRFRNTFSCKLKLSQYYNTDIFGIKCSVHLIRWGYLNFVCDKFLILFFLFSL